MSKHPLRDRAALVGVGETVYVRRSERPFKDLQLEAINKAIADAGMTPADIDGLITDQVVMSTLFPIEEAVASLKMPNVSFSAYTPAVGAGITNGPLLAAMAIANGVARNVLIYFGVDWGSSTGGPYAYHEHYPHKLSFELPYGFYGQPVYFAAMARRYQYEHGYTDEDMVQGLGTVALTCRKHAMLHPNAQVRKPMTMDDYRSAPYITSPLRFPDCCLITDGAAAVVVSSAERAKDCPHDPVYIMGGGHAVLSVAGDSFFSQNPDYTTITAAEMASAKAFEMAGVGPKEIDFAEVYDCFTISTIMQLEAMGFCARGEGIRFVQEGRIELGGALPVNTCGGQLSQGYILGMNHIVEAVCQLRGEAGERQVQGAEIGLVTAAPDSVHSTVVLRR